ncbi:MAG: hypothetical protein Q8P18_07320 [Pseudomonadota bacterium]|nr:hypothetical protein [Pseudomonadota bacterium]
MILLLLSMASMALASPSLNSPGGEVTLPWNDFQTLYQKGLAPEKPPEKAPLDYTLDRASYTGRLVNSRPGGDDEDGYGLFKLTLRGSVHKDKGWVTIPLLSTSAALRSAKVDGRDAAIFLRDGFYTLVTNRTGPFTAEIEFSTGLFTADGETGLSLPMAPSGATEVTFTVEGDDAIDFEIAGARGQTASALGKSRTVTAAIPSLGSLAVSWQRALPEVEKEAAKLPRVYAETNVLIGVSEGVMQGTARVNYTVLHKGVDTLRVQLPTDVTVLDVQGPGIRDWAQSADGTITVKLNYDALGAYLLSVDYERPLTGNAILPTPKVLDVAREKTWIGVDARSALELVSGEATGAVPVDVRELPASLVGQTDYPVLLAWKARGGDVKIPLEVKSHPDVDMLVTLVDTAVADTLVTPDGRRMTRVRYGVRNNRRQFLRLSLPEGAEVWSASVAGRGVKVAAGEGGGVLVPLVRSDASGGALTGFLVELIYVENGAPLADGRGELRVDLPRADAPTSQLQWTVYFPENAKVQKKGHEGTVRQVPYFSSAPQLPSDATVGPQAQGNAQRAAQNQEGAGALGQGVEPVRVELPLAGQVHTYEKMLVLDEPLWVSFGYVRHER